MNALDDDSPTKRGVNPVLTPLREPEDRPVKELQESEQE
jgi:hypothetical protein